MVHPMNGYIFIKKITETKKVGGLDVITAYDSQDRYKKGKVKYVADLLEEGDIVLYDELNGHDFQDEDGELLTVLHLKNVIGIL